ncbi:hypothetical protein DBN73_17845, partial [Enterococcus faecalis]|uniref:DUF3290 family protein n=1 Tax=Enterococcus faecalis TaxID=1351 RepID=UPI0015610504
KHSQSSQMVNFVKGLAKQENIDANEIYANATQFSDGIIVKFNYNWRIELHILSSLFRIDNVVIY